MPFLSMLLYAFVSSFTPGPNNIMAMLFANKYGFKQTLRFCLGVGAGLTVISTFIIPYHTLHLSLLYNSLLLAFIGFMGTFSWSVFGSIFKTVLSKYRNQCNVVMALLLLYSAISILFI
ncbi:hypothetical protein ACEU2D_12640 [Brevibacillus laterosporus]|uniref:hypothetical protein n=1 Tax=Brevibacillus laterosporus TaxID=1465 RepID=UPI0035A5C80F